MHVAQLLHELKRFVCLSGPIVGVHRLAESMEQQQSKRNRTIKKLISYLILRPLCLPRFSRFLCRSFLRRSGRVASPCILQSRIEARQRKQRRHVAVVDWVH
jgi:hypothetical protein